ncbi:putative immunity/bacteriocin fusion bifunctional protein [Bacillus atrophaeus]|uniref:putative immunity/bacteriocin fusion bifunctional protein n=1 Tax=Bacillus atrophaeus TaxID=1452 RepID=UPI00227E0298|nr:putative immunity/bacteriocin fusion bifunctional protein [Bacillus atrophaeus]MCY8517504.1 putative immunity/bacteriocin fusion bifunctional protein [Bacillus atrophaeus]MCY9110723.1 putative immunity/bacteriocin fusion bifunctional protein [Bacillus atrophaeus]
MRKKLALILAVAIMALLPLNASATTKNGSGDQECQTCSKGSDKAKLIKEIKDVYNIDVETLSNKGVKEVEQLAAEKSDKFKDTIDKYKDLGYKKVDLKDKSLLYKNAQIDKDGTKSDLEFVYGVYKNEKGDVITYTLGYAKETKKFFNFSVLKVPHNSKNQDDVTVLIQKNDSNFKVFGKDNAVSSPGQMSTQGFSWSGKSFACGMLGVLACINYCGVVTLAFPPAGVACDVVCGAAMAAACA